MTNKGSWHGWDITLEGVVDQALVYGQAKQFAESIQAGDVEVKHTKEGDDASDDTPF